MKIGIDGNMWYCSNGICLAERNAKYVFEPTLREAVTQFNKQFNKQEAIPSRLLAYADQSPAQYFLQEKSHL
jgi:hypothetical protein